MDPNRDSKKKLVLYLGLIPGFCHLGHLGIGDPFSSPYMAIYDSQICHGCGGDTDFIQKSKVLDAI